MQTKCGFDNVPGGVSGVELLVAYGPTLIVHIGFDPDYKPTAPILSIPVPGIKGVDALVDTGATESCIDNLLATQLKLPIADRRPISGIQGKQLANMHLAQIHVPYLKFTIYGMFAAVDLVGGGQRHKALIGRTFLRNYTMTYEGRTGTVIISND